MQTIVKKKKKSQPRYFTSHILFNFVPLGFPQQRLQRGAGRVPLANGTVPSGQCLDFTTSVKGSLNTHNAEVRLDTHTHTHVPKHTQLGNEARHLARCHRALITSVQFYIEGWRMCKMMHSDRTRVRPTCLQEDSIRTALLCNSGS